MLHTNRPTTRLPSRVPSFRRIAVTVTSPITGLQIALVSSGTVASHLADRGAMWTGRRVELGSVWEALRQHEIDSRLFRTVAGRKI